MQKKKQLATLLLLAIAMVSYAVVSPFLQDDPRRRQRQPRPAPSAQESQKSQTPQKALPTAAQPILVDEDTIPDSLLHPRWKIQRTQPITYDDLDQSAMDLKRPDALHYDVTYNDSLNVYVIGTKMGSTYLAAPIMMTPEEYMDWSMRQQRNIFYRGKERRDIPGQGQGEVRLHRYALRPGTRRENIRPRSVRIKTQERQS